MAHFVPLTSLFVVKVRCLRPSHRLFYAPACGLWPVGSALRPMPCTVWPAGSDGAWLYWPILWVLAHFVGTGCVLGVYLFLFFRVVTSFCSRPQHPTSNGSSNTATRFDPSPSAPMPRQSHRGLTMSCIRDYFIQGQAQWINGAVHWALFYAGAGDWRRGAITI